MELVEKLEARARELDHRVKNSLSTNGYDFKAANDRDLLEEAAHYIRVLEQEGAEHRAI